MARLTNKDRDALRTVLQHLERGANYLMQDNIAVCRASDIATTSLHYVRQDGTGKALFQVQKEYGSDLCGLQDAIHLLGAFLATH